MVDDGARIAYEVRADHPSGVPILALHGVLVGTSNWIHQMLRLPQFHWIAPSIRGHGDSSPAGASPSIERAALDALAVLDAEGVDRAVVIGNSLGATIGLALALLRPERVLALLLAEPSIPQLLHNRGGDRLSAAAERARPLLESGRIDDALDIFLTPRVGADWRHKVGRRRLAEWRKNVLSTPAWFDAVEAFNPGPGPLAALDVPTLLVYGADTQPEYRDTDAGGGRCRAVGRARGRPRRRAWLSGRQPRRVQRAAGRFPDEARAGFRTLTSPSHERRKG